jgi:uncharacterized protein YoxC
MLASLVSDIFVIVIAVGIFAVCVFGSYALLKTAFVLESTKQLLDGVKDQTVPLLGEVKTTVMNVNRELDRTDTILESAGNMAKSVERLTSVVEQTVSSPLIKFVAFGAGAGKAVKKFFGG